MSKCSADETPVCCCMDVGTIMDNTDCTASYSRVFANRAEAEQTLAALSEKARNVESESVRNLTQPSLKLTAVCSWISILFSACEAEIADLPAGPALIPSPGLRSPLAAADRGVSFSFSSLCLGSQFCASPIGLM